MLCSIDIHTVTGNISAKKFLLYSIYDGVTRRSPISNVGIESVDSADQAGFNYQALV